jgi:hypothetical protein
MKVQLKRSGGVAGLLPPPVTVDSDNLSSEDAKKLQELLSAANFFSLPSKGPTPPRGADRYQYTLTVDTGDRTHQVQVTEDQLSQNLRSLIDWLPQASARASK